MIRQIVILLFAIGIMLPAAGGRADLVTNGGFETGDFTGWTSTGTFISVVTSSYVHTGTYGARMGTTGPTGGSLSQTLATTAGQAYQVDWWLKSTSGTPNFFKVEFGSTTLQSITDGSGSGFTHFSGIATATSASTLLKFSERHDPLYWGLDDISVIPTENVVTNNEVTQAVPLPASVWGGLALLGVIGYRRIRRSRA